jgi:hypothetical protein
LGFFLSVTTSSPVPFRVTLVFAMMQIRAQVRRCWNRAGAENCLGRKYVGPARSRGTKCNEVPIQRSGQMPRGDSVAGTGLKTRTGTVLTYNR